MNCEEAKELSDHDGNEGHRTCIPVHKNGGHETNVGQGVAQQHHEQNVAQQIAVSEKVSHRNQMIEAEYPQQPRTIRGRVHQQTIVDC